MNARERLRQFLEQRRELGESELVLDRMSVDEVLRIVGAAPQGADGPPRAASGSAAAAGARAGEPGPPPAPPLPPDPATELGAPADHPRLRDEGEPGVQDLPPRPQVVPERTERVIADPALDAAAERGDWRAALRAADPAAGEAGDTNAGASAGVEASEVARRATNSPGASTPEGRGGDPGEQPSAGMAESTAPGAAGVADAADGERAVARLAPVSGAHFPGTDILVGLVVGAEATLLGGPFDHLDTLAAVARTVHDCTRCPLYRTATKGVPGEGNPDADFVVVGEAPGADEDASGRPFVGASGQLLTKILAAINLAREDVFICNVVKHRPPGNRNPSTDEVEACSPYLVRQLELVRPKVILTVGNFAAQTLLGTKLGISKLRGQVHLYHGVPLVATYHPAALLRNPAWKRPTWEDVQLARRLLDRAPGPTG